MADPRYALWFAEQKEPTPEDRRADRTTDPYKMSGFWRSIGPRTGYDMPVAIWTDDGQTATIFQRGSYQPQNTEQHADTWQKFINVGWLKSVAVSHKDYHLAMTTGRWPDGKAAREMTEEEKRGVDLSPGANAAPLDEALRDQIAALAESIDDLPEPTTKTEADVLSGMLDRMRLLLKKAEDARVAEKAPVLQQGKDIDARWGSIKKPGDDAYAAAEKRRKSFLKKEQDRLNAEAAAENERRRKAAEEEAARIAEETARRLAEQMPDLSEAEIVEQAQAAAETQVAPVEEVQAPRATSGSAFGRQTGLKKVVRGKITDLKAFLCDPQIINRDEVKELAQTLANRAAKGGFTIAGMEVEKDLE